MWHECHMLPSGDRTAQFTLRKSCETQLEFSSSIVMFLVVMLRCMTP